MFADEDAWQAPRGARANAAHDPLAATRILGQMIVRSSP